MRSLVLFAAATLALAAWQVSAADTKECNKPLVIETDVNKPMIGSLLTDDMTAKCAYVTFGTVAQSDATKGKLTTNIRGMYTYQPPKDQETADRFTVVVSCIDSPMCTLTVVVGVSAPVTLPPSPPQTQQPAPPVVECPQVYYFQTGAGQVLSATLRNRVGQLPCADEARSFAKTRGARLGELTQLTMRGDFQYAATNDETWDDFGFEMFCRGQLVCKGTANVMISKSIQPAPPASNPDTPPAPPAEGPSTPQEPPAVPPVVVPPTPPKATDAPYTNTKYQTCRGTCNTDAFKAIPNQPNLWDTDKDAASGDHPRLAPRADGRPIGSVDVSWKDGDLTITHYGKVGNLAQRFPTFEPIKWAASGSDLLSAINVLAQAKQSSLPFDAQCLAQQDTAGMGPMVWAYDSVPNRTGGVGSRYKTGTAWYHKFGGAHINCDSFKESCLNAPLLTPRAEQDPTTGGVWSVDIDGCDATWTGTFSYQAMRTMTRKDGSPIWTMRPGNFIETILYSEGVQPNSWVEAAAGYSTNVVPRSLRMDLEPWLEVRQSADAAHRFSADVEYFNYQLENGDAAFGLNILFYPHLTAQSASSYAKKSHVTGFRWTRQDWSNPDEEQCPSCSGTQNVCTYDARSASDGSFWTDAFPAGDCTNPKVQLFKGPSMSRAACTANKMHVFNRRGFSAPSGCRTSFQNITVRGTAPGSGSGNATIANDFAFEGKIDVQLLLDNGHKTTLSIDLSLFIAMVTDDSPSVATSDLCRASPYWPVYDPIGTSTPANPHRLSDAEPGFLCVDRLDRTYGPTGWALLSYDVEGVPSERVRVQSLHLSYPGSPQIFLVNNDAVTGAASSSAPASAGSGAVWWADRYPFLNFRQVTTIIGNASGIAHPVGVQPPSQRDFGALLTPGALGVATDVTAVCVLQVLTKAAGEEGSAVASSVTVRRKIRIDPTLTALSRFGPQKVVHQAMAETQPGSLAAMVATGVLLGGLVLSLLIVAGSNTKQPLPAWLPRSDQMKKLFPGPQKPVDTTKRATKGGLPVNHVV